MRAQWTSSYMTRLVRLVYLSPEVVAAIVAGGGQRSGA